MSVDVLERSLHASESNRVDISWLNLLIFSFRRLRSRDNCQRGLQISARATVFVQEISAKNPLQVIDFM